MYGICYLGSNYTEWFKNRENWEHVVDGIAEESSFDVWFEGNIAIVDTGDPEFADEK